jgi:hypothetical protein
MGLRPTHGDESHKRCRPRVSGDPRPVVSRFRGNDVTFDGVSMGLRPTHGDESHKRCRPRVSGDPRQVVPAFAGMT